VTTTTASTVDWPAWEDPAFYLQDPEAIHASMAAQRRAAPVYWYEPAGFPTGFWVLSKWEDVRFVAAHHELFSNRYGFGIGDARDPATVIDQLPDWAQVQLREQQLTAAQTRGLIARAKLSLGDPGLENMQVLDPPRHTHVRNIFMKALRPSLVRSLKPEIHTLTDDFLDEIEPRVMVDFVTTVGQIPAALMTELIGVPREMREQFIEMGSAQVQVLTMTPDKDAAEVERIKGLLADMHVYCGELLDSRRATAAARDDLISAVLRSELDGAPVDGLTFVLFVKAFVAAGETTRDMLSFLARLLAEHPDQRRLLVEQPELIPGAIEEALRYSPPVWTSCRTATEPVRIGRHTIEKDDYVVLAYASASRDEDVWERADAFDVARPSDRDHFGFGYGAHSCPGALLARVDSAAILERLLKRFPNWELAGDSRTWSTPHLQGMVSLPLRFDG
jgi:cytochrome P450